MELGNVFIQNASQITASDTIDVRAQRELVGIDAVLRTAGGQGLQAPNLRLEARNTVDASTQMQSLSAQVYTVDDATISELDDLALSSTIAPDGSVFIEAHGQSAKALEFKLRRHDINDIRTVEIIAEPFSAEVFEWTPDGLFTYRSIVNWSGSDSFQYLVTDGTASEVYTVRFELSVSEFVNIDPRLQISSTQSSVDEGGAYTLDLSSIDYPGTVFGWTIHWGDGDIEYVSGDPSSVSHVYVDGNESHRILAMANTDDGTYQAVPVGDDLVVAPDPNFGDGGETLLDFVSSTQDYPRQLSVTRPDGKILVAGESSAGGKTTIALAQYLADGRLDPSFGVDGTQVTDFGRTVSVRSMAVDSLGRVVLGEYFGLVRYLADGTLDTSFGVDGWIAEPDYVTDIAIDSRDRIVASTDFYLHRFNADGTRDASFNNGLAVNLGQKFESAWSWPWRMNHLAIDHLDRVVLTGHEDYLDGDIIIARLDEAGQRDSSFAPASLSPTTVGYTTVGYHDGYVHIDVDSRDDSGQHVVIQGDGILVAASTRLGSSDSRLALVRLTSSGTLDTTFGTGGEEGDGIVDVPGAAGTTALALGSNSEVLIGNGREWIRLTADGELDATLPGNYWRGNGRILTDTYVFGIGEYIDPHGDRFVITIGADYNGPVRGNDFAITRYSWADGGVDSTFGASDDDGVDGVVYTDFQGSRADYGRLSLSQPDGKVVVAGFTSNSASNTGTAVLARYLPGGQLDTDFGNADGDGVDGTTFTSGGVPVAIALDDQGRLLVVTSGTVSRFNSDGTPDLSFGSDPSTNRIVTWQLLFVADLVVSNGKIIVGGYQNRQSVNSLPISDDFAVARFNGDGSLDTTFSQGDGDGIDGINYLDFGSTSTLASWERIESLTVDADGNIVAAGHSFDGSEPANIAVVRYNSDGTLDTNFGQGSSSNSDGTLVTEDIDGLVLTDFDKNGSEYGHAVAIDRHGRIYVGGDNALAAYRPDGIPETDFGGDGKLTLESPIAALVIDDNDRIVVGGIGALSRYLPTGAPDAGFGEEGTLPVEHRNVRALAIDGAGRIIAVGETEVVGPTGHDIFVGRYLDEALRATVTNVAPEVVTATLSSITNVQGDLVTVRGRVSDVGVHDALTVSISWGPGQGSTSVTAGQLTAVAGMPGFYDFSAQHLYSGSSTGYYTISTSVADEDGETSAALTQTVAASPAAISTVVEALPEPPLKVVTSWRLARRRPAYRSGLMQSRRCLLLLAVTKLSPSL